MNGENSGAGGGAACPNCGKVNRTGVTFCEDCGEGLASAINGQPQPPRPVAPPPSIVPPVGAPPVTAPPPSMAPPPYGSQQVVIQHAVMGPGNSGLCVASLVLGIISVVFLWVPFFGIVLGILATIFGAVGMPSAAKRGQAGRGMGIAGLILGIIALAANVIFIIVVWGIFSTSTTYYYKTLLQPVFPGIIALV